MMRRVVLSLRSASVAALALVPFFAGCTTARRTTGVIVDHHVGMVRDAADVMSGAAEEREKRFGELLDKLNQDRESLKSETEVGALARHLRQHVEIQDEVIAALMARSHKGHHNCCRARQANERDEESGAPEATGDISSMVWKASTAQDHERIVAYYRQEKDKLLARAAKHLELAKGYRSLAPRIDASDQAKHCEKLVRSLQDAAKEYDALAAFHEEAAAKLRQSSR